MIQVPLRETIDFASNIALFIGTLLEVLIWAELVRDRMDAANKRKAKRLSSRQSLSRGDETYGNSEVGGTEALEGCPLAALGYCPRHYRSASPTLVGDAWTEVMSAAFKTPSGKRGRA